MKEYSLRKMPAQAADLSFQEMLLWNRGHETVEQISRFLNPDYAAHIHDPFLLKDMEKAVDRILRAIKNSEKVIVYTDYDTDGIPGGVLFHDFFKKAGFTNFTNYIPHRHDEGFGVNSEAVKQFIADGAQLVITIDCGIADIGPIGEATAAGIDVIITDHHIPSGSADAPELPRAFAIVNPKQADCPYPEKMLCGSGVAFKLIQGILKKDRLGIKEGWEKWLLDMVGIATLSDMVPLTGENRVFAYFGLAVLRKSPRAGLSRLLLELGVDQRQLTEDDIGFTIGPRINAASRMGLPMDAFHMLSTSDPLQAAHVVKHLNTINDERKVTVATLVKEIKKTIKERWGGGSGGHGENVGSGSKKTAKGKNRTVEETDGKTDEKSDGDEKMPDVIVLGNPDWRPSLVGLAANNVAEEYRRPVYLWGRDGDGIIKGSCRSDGETNLVELMREADAIALAENSNAGKNKNPSLNSSSHSSALFIQFGGHALSGGFAIANDKVHELPDKLNAAFKKLHHSSVSKKNQEVFFDKELSLSDVTWETYDVIAKLAPFGMGNPKPLFIFKKVTPISVRHFGKEKNHLEISFGEKYHPVKAIAFFKTSSDWKAALGRDISSGEPITLVASFEKSIFRGKTELRLRIVDVIV